MKGAYFIAVTAMILALSGCEKKVSEHDYSTEKTTLSVGLAPVSRTYLGPSQEGKRKVYWADGTLVTIFRAPASVSPSSGTVSVRDRFGNTYSRTVSW